MTRTEKWNPLDFQCTMQCSYCPEKNHSETPQLRENWQDIPNYFAIWVCEDTDLFCPEVPDDPILDILRRARKSRDKAFLFSTKNPKRFQDFLDEFPRWTYFVTTVESDIDHHFSKAEPPMERLKRIKELKYAISLFDSTVKDWHVCIAIQPIMHFTNNFANAIHEAMPNQISIGYELTGIEGFPTPDFSKVLELAKELSEFTMVSIHDVQIFEYTYLEEWPPRRYCSESLRSAPVLESSSENRIWEKSK